MCPWRAAVPPTPADTLRSHLGRPQALAALLGPAGVHPQHEVVVMAESGLTPGAALVFLVLEQPGQKTVTVLMNSVDSVDGWGVRGHALAKEPTVVGTPRTAKDIRLPAANHAAQPRAAVLISDRSGGQRRLPAGLRRASRSG